MMRNFVKRCLVIITVMVTIVLMSACKKEDDTFKRNECSIEFNFGSYGEFIGRYGDMDIPRIIIYEGEDLGENDEIKKYLKEIISEITNEEVHKIIKARYSFNKNYSNPIFDVNGYYSTRDRAYSFTLKVEPDNINLFEAIRNDLKDSYIKIDMSEPLQRTDEVEWYIGTVEWCEEKASSTSETIKEKMIKYFNLWGGIKPQEVIIYMPWTGIREDYEVFVKFENQWFKAVMPMIFSPLDEKEKKEIEQFTEIIHTEFLQSEYYAELLRRYGD